MSSLKYHTIDPLILETLNLNERRMNHILNILHGRPTNPAQQSDLKQSPKKKLSSKAYFQNSLREQGQSSSRAFGLLPDINKRRSRTIQVIGKDNKARDRNIGQRDKHYMTLDDRKIQKDNSNIGSRMDKTKSLQHRNNNISHNRSIDLSDIQSITKVRENSSKPLKKAMSERKPTLQEPLTPISLLGFSKIQSPNIQHSQRSSRNSLSAVRSKLVNKKFQSPSLKQLSPPNATKETILEQSLLPSPSLITQQVGSLPISYKKKTQQLLNDYMGQYSLKKSKSLQILNPKDIYRLEIENIIAELTPIQKLEEAEKRMKRIKKRHQHLKKFDQKYYSKLNQMDLVGL